MPEHLKNTIGGRRCPCQLMGAALAFALVAIAAGNWLPAQKAAARGESESDLVIAAAPQFRVVIGGMTRDAPCDLSALSQHILCSDRASIRTWAASQTLANLNAQVAQLTPDLKARLPGILLDTNGSQTIRSLLLDAMRKAVNNSALGFYVEIFSYTKFNIQGGGFFGTCNNVYLSESAYSGLQPQDQLTVLLHESFHSFNSINGGPSGALDEGSAIVIFKFAFPELFTPSEDWAEATYGTKLYYRDIGVGPKQPDYLLGASRAPTPKLLDVYQWLSSKDRSKLPWNSTPKLQRCFNSYFAPINRNTDFFAVWLPAANAASLRMLADASCRPD